MAELAFFLIFVLVPAAYLVSVVLGDVLLWRLKKRHSETWEALGRPTCVFSYRINETVAVLRFLWRREYRSLPDKRSIRLAALVRGLFVATFVTAVVVVGLSTVMLGPVLKQALAKVREMRGG